MGWNDLDFDENLGLLAERVDQLSHNDEELAHILYGIMRYIEHTEEMVFGVTDEKLIEAKAFYIRQSRKWRKEVKEEIDKLAEDIPEVRVLNKKMDDTFALHDKLIDHLFIRSYRHERDDERKTPPA